MDHKGIKKEEEWEKNSNLQKEIVANISDKNSVEKFMAKDRYEISPEKKRNLGMLKEDILYSYTYSQMDLPETYKKLGKDLSDPKVNKAIISGDLYMEALTKVMGETKKHNKPFTIVQDSIYEGELALILVKKT